MTNSASEAQALKREVTTQGIVLGGLVALMWAIEVVDLGFGGDLAPAESRVDGNSVRAVLARWVSPFD
jgi:hypothetical protein